MSAQPQAPKPARPSIPGAIRFFRGASGLVTAAELLAMFNLAADVADLTECAERVLREHRAEQGRSAVHGTANADILG